MSTEAPTAPSEHFSITLNEKTHELFMSFGLMNTLAIPIRTVDELIDIDQNPDLRNFILSTCLDKRNEKGLVTEPFDLNKIGYQQGEEILEWVRGHLTDFFITRLRNKTVTQRQVNQTLIKS